MTDIRRYLPIPLLVLLAWLWLPSPAPAKTIIGVIMPSTTPYAEEVQRVFKETLKAEGQNADMEVVVLHPFPDSIALGNSTRKLVAIGAELLVTYGTNATIAALNEQTKLPLIYSGVYDPENAPFARLDLTGCGYKVPLTSLIRYLRQLKPINTVSAIYCSLENDTVRQVNELTEITREQRIALIPINIKADDELDFTQMNKGDAVIITGGSIVNLRLPEILAMAQTHQQPSITILPDANEAGVTISLYSNPKEQSRKTAQMAAQVLAGREIREIKPETLRNNELVFNLRAAKSIGVKIPFQLVAEAGRVIK